MLVPVVFLLVPQLIGLNQAAESTTLCRKVIDTVLYAAPENVDWALDEPIEESIGKLVKLVDDTECMGEISARELQVVTYIMKLLEHEDDCRINAVDLVVQVSTAIAHDPRRAELFGGSAPPKQLRLDDWLKEKLEAIQAACRGLLAPIVVHKNRKLKDEDSSGLLGHLAEINAQAKLEMQTAKVKDQIYEEIVQSIGRECEFKKNIEPISENGRGTFYVCFYDRLIRPCQIVSTASSTTEQLIKAAQRGKIGELSQSVKDWLEKREVCTRFELQAHTTPGRVYEKFADAVREGKLEVKRGKQSLLSSFG